MSGVVKGVKKVFKAVGKFVKKIAKPVLIAAAVYFTGGLALSAFGPTQAFAATMLPGFGVSASGAATGIFSKAAAVIGLDAGLVAGAAKAAGTTAAGGVGAVANMNAMGAAKAGAGVGAAVGPPASLAGSASVVGPAAAGMSLVDKLMLASIGTKAVGAFLAPGLDESYTEAKRWRGAFYGTYADGSGAQEVEAATPAGAAEAQQPSQAIGPQPGGQPPPRELMPSQPQAAPQSAQVQAAPGAAPPSAAPIENAPIESRQLMQPGVRYV